MTQSPPPVSSASERLQELTPVPGRGIAKRFSDKSGYDTPIGKLSSTTTVLSRTSKGKDRLEKWLANPANASVSESARNRGTWLHSCNESWLEAHKAGEPLPDFKHFAYGAYWRSMKPFLERHMVQMIAQELAVWHPGLHVAGQFDCLGYCSYTEQEGVSEEDASDMVTLMDWKTSQNFRGHRNGDFRDKNGNPSELVDDYFHQLGCYAMMIDYCYGVKPDRALLVIARPSKEWPDIWELTGEELAEYGKRFMYRANSFFTCEEGYES